MQEMSTCGRRPPGLSRGLRVTLNEKRESVGGGKE